MLVDKSARAPQDLSRVTLTEDWEVRYWCNRYSVSETELRACVVEAGPQVESVEQRLKHMGKKIFKNTGED